jgi:hypothetical protein
MATQKTNRRAGDAAARESDRFGRLIAPSNTTPKNPRASGPHPRACAEAALEQERAEVAATATGRNDRLNVAAFRLDRFLGAGLIERSLVERSLVAAAEASGDIGKDGAYAPISTPVLERGCADNLSARHSSTSTRTHQSNRRSGDD